MNFNHYGGRRFILAVGSLVVSTLMLACDKIIGAEYVTLCSMTYGMYIAGNGWQKHVEVGAKKDEQQ